MARAVDGAHPPFADLLDERVGPEPPRLAHRLAEAVDDARRLRREEDGESAEKRSVGGVPGRVRQDGDLLARVGRVRGDRKQNGG